MDALEKFDKEIFKINSYSILGNNVAKYLCSFIVIILVPIYPSADNGWLINIGQWLLFEAAISNSIQPLIYIKSEPLNKLPIFALIRDTPIDRNIFIRSRIKYLLSYTAKLTAICIILKIFFIFAFDSASPENIFGSVLCIGVIVLTTTLSVIHDIYRSTRYYREVA